VKTRKIQRTHHIPHTVDGKTRMVPETVTIDVPVPPRDWDSAVLTGVTVIAALVLTASVVWSTASIGDLLTRVVIAPAAYGAAVVFDLVWIACMAIEWLARYDTERAALPRKAGHVALLIAMGAVGAHGWLSGYLVIGIVGAVVSCLAKGLWTVLLDHQAPRAPPGAARAGPRDRGADRSGRGSGQRSGRVRTARGRSGRGGRSRARRPDDHQGRRPDRPGFRAGRSGPGVGVRPEGGRRQRESGDRVHVHPTREAGRLMFAVFCLVAMVGGVCGLAAVAPRDVPPIVATTLFILALAAYGAAVIR